MFLDDTFPLILLSFILVCKPGRAEGWLLEYQVLVSITRLNLDFKWLREKI